jgi:hypothetical protein
VTLAPTLTHQSKIQQRRTLTDRHNKLTERRLKLPTRRMKTQATLQLHTQGPARTRTASIPQIQHKTALHWQCPGNYDDSWWSWVAGWRVTGGGGAFQQTTKTQRRQRWKTGVLKDILLPWGLFNQRLDTAHSTVLLHRKHRQQHFRSTHNTCLVSPPIMRQLQCQGFQRWQAFCRLAQDKAKTDDFLTCKTETCRWLL